MMPYFIAAAQMLYQHGTELVLTLIKEPRPNEPAAARSDFGQRQHIGFSQAARL